MLSRSESVVEPIAIVGIGCRYPGNVDSPEAFWRLLCEGRDAVGEVPPDRWLLRAFYDPDPAKPEKTYTRHGGFLSGVDRFDPAFFGISAREAATMDPQHRLILECTWGALEDAGFAAERLAGTNTGVFVGISTHDYGDGLSSPLDGKRDKKPYHALGSAQCIAANRVSYFLNLSGPSLAVDTACSSSLVALHLACQSVWQQESCLAVVGGVNLILRPQYTIGFGDAGMLAPDGRCKSFDAAADGFARAEGAGVVLLKPLAAARRDGDKVYAVILGTATNQDGRTPGITVPSEAAQAALVRRACARAGVRPAELQYVEAHGTGTPVGDPIELRALGAVLGEGRAADQPCLVGSVKSNIGHVEAGAGVAGLIKLALALYHGQLPATIHFRSPTPNVDLNALRLQVVDRLRPWPAPAGGRRLAGINSFGFGGSNAHAILAGPPPCPERPAAEGPDGEILLPLSAKSPEALAALARSYRDLLALGGEELPLGDLAYSASVRRSHHDHRLALVAASQGQLIDLLEASQAGEPRPGLLSGRAPAGGAPRLVFVFTGMGPQWGGMGRQLLAREPAFREAVARCDELFRRHADWSVLEELHLPEGRSRIPHDDQIAQMSIFAVQVGLTALWRSWGVVPDVVLGHSTGEMAASHAAGALSLEDAVLLSYHRSRLQAQVAGQGKMLAAALSAGAAEALLAPYRGRVELAAINSPSSVTLSGEAAALADLQEQLNRAGTFCRLLHADTPYHSSKMEPLRAELLEVLAGLSPRRPAVRLYSTATASLIDGPTLDAEYWWHNLRCPVQFAGVVEHLLQRGHALFLEVGPHPVLAASIQDCARAAGKEAVVLASLRRREPERPALLAALGRLYTLGRPVRWEALHPAGGRLVPLPPYPWQREPFWHERPLMRQLRTGEAAWTHSGHIGPAVHPLLGLALASAHTEATWEGEIDLQRDHAWLRDHRVQGAVVYPAAAQLEAALAAAGLLFGAEYAALSEVELERPLVLTPDAPQPVQLLVDRHHKTFALHARQPGGDWVRYSAGKLGKARPGPAAPPVPLEAVQARCQRVLDREPCYQYFRTVGLEYGPLFQGVERLWMGDREALARVCLPGPVAACLGDFLVHPALLDAGFHTLLGAVDHSRPDLYLPARIDRLQLHRRPAEAVPPGPDCAFWVHARLSGQDEKWLQGDFRVLDAEGQVLVSIEGLRCQRLPLQGAGPAGAGGLLYEERWLLQAPHGQLPPRTPAWRLPGPRELAAAVRPLTEVLVREHDLARQHRQGVPLIDRLSRAYFVAACRHLGWPIAPGERHGTDDLLARLRIVPEYHRLFHRLLEDLEAAGLLRRVAGEWEAVGAPEDCEPDLLWRECVARVPAYHPYLLLLGMTGPKLADVLAGAAGPLEALFPGGSTAALEQFFQGAPDVRIFQLMVQQVVAELVGRLHPQRPLRVLEIGGGTGGTTAHVLPVLPAGRTSYLFTDVSRQFTAPAEERFAPYPFVRCRVLDIEQDPLAQGFEPHSFDVILAGDVLHATADLRRTLGRVKQLLAPEGLLVLMEPNQDFILPVFGILRGWWSFTDHDLRPNSPTLPGPRWCGLLRACGFPEAECLTDLPWEEGPIHSVIVAQGPRPGASRERERTGPSPAAAAPNGAWLILADQSGAGEQLAAAFRELGRRPVLAFAGEDFRRPEPGRFRVRPEEPRDWDKLLAAEPAWAGVLHLWGLDIGGLPLNGRDLPRAEQEVFDTQDRACLSVVRLLQAWGRTAPGPAPRLWLVTRGAQPVGTEPLALAQAPLWGVGRVLANEQPEFRCGLLDLGPAGGAEEIERLAQELCADGPETEVAHRGADRYVHRLLPLPWAEPVNARGVAPGGQVLSTLVPFRLQASASGLAEGLALWPCSRQAPGAGQVEIEVHATGLNFKDVAKTVGLLGDASLKEALSGWQLGLECAGRVAAVGEGVSGLRPGDAVTGLVLGSFASHALTDARFVVPKPAHLTFEEAATLPLVFLTAYYALHHLGDLQPGERLLVHAASGGVGLAAVQLARRAGAEVFATAGSPEKRQFLRALGVPHVMNSRSLDFVEEVLARTGGEGIDVVLNSLGGEALVRSLSLLRRGGRFLELGKRDLELNTRLGLRPFLKRLSFFAIDLDLLLADRPELPVRLLHEVLRQVADGKLAALPHVVFPVGRAGEAFQTLLKARHVGKVVVSTQEPHVTVPRPTADAQLRADATYLISGGLGGFGLATAAWLVERGARHLVLLGRGGAATPAAQEAVASLRGAGATVVVARADVTRADQVAAVLAEVRRDLPPLRGVIHAAMVLDDCPLPQLTPERLQAVLGPKLRGAWNLHALTLDDPLDLFVLFSSSSAVVGTPGQANYAAGNLFLDLLAHERRRRGLPALAVNFGPVADAGHLVGRADVTRAVERLGGVPLPARLLLEALGRLLQSGAVGALVQRADWARCRQALPAVRAPRFSGVAPAGGEQGEAKAASSFREALLAAPPEERRALLAGWARQEVAKVVGTPAGRIDEEVPLTQLGLDSLMALELGTRLQKGLGASLPTMAFMSGPSVSQLTDSILQLLLVGSSRVDLQACKLEYSIVSPK